MDVTASIVIECPPEQLRPWIDDLTRYSEWLSILPRADRLGEEPVWDVELRAKVGPLARSKRLRMRRTVDEALRVRFERDEIDGRSHSPWVLDAVLHPEDDSTRLEMRLHYGGSFGGGLVEKLLTDEIDRSRARLKEMVEAGRPAP